MIERSAFPERLAPARAKQRLSAPTQAADRVVASISKGSLELPFLLVVRDEERTLRFPLSEGEHLLGSSRECSPRLPHPTVSRRHARLSVVDGRIEIADLGSSNGTKVDGKLLSDALVVEPGAELTFGSLEARLDTIEQADLEPAVVFEEDQEALAPLAETGLPDSTLGVGSFRQFALVELRHLLAQVDRGEPLVQAQAAGASLARSLPSARVEILGLSAEGQDALVFSSQAPASGSEEAVEDAPAEAPVSSSHAVIEREAGDYRLRATFAHPTQARLYRPLVESVAKLIEIAQELAGRRSLRSRAVAPAPGEPPPLPEPPTVEPSVAALYADAARVAQGDISILITGDSGTGKEVLARFLHAASPRQERAFVALNCAALPRDLLETELFGIEKGVATGVDSRPGKFELADGGTLFLDEIGDMAAETQAKILRVLQEREVYRLGSTEPRPARVRIVAATNRDLDAMLENGEFRTDLYHRIADWRVRLPSLAQRAGDITNLAAYFLARESKRRGARVAGISQGALAVLRDHPWPGNIRQLEREMARAALFVEDGEMLQTRHLQKEILRGARATPGAKRGGTLRQRLETVEREEIEAALDANLGNIVATAKQLGIGRSTLYRRMQELEIGAREDAD